MGHRDVCWWLFTLLVAVMILSHPVFGNNPSSAATESSQETPSASSKQPEKRGTVRLTGVPGITAPPGTLRYYSTNSPNTQQTGGYTQQQATQYDNYARTASSASSSTASTPATYDYVKAYPTQPYTTPVQSTYQPQYVLPTPYPTQAIPYSSANAMFFVLPHGHNGNPYSNYVIVPTPYQGLHSPLQYNGLPYPTGQTPIQRVAFAYVVPQLIPLKALHSAPNGGGNGGYQNNGRPNSGYYNGGGPSNNNNNRYPSSDYSYSSGESGYNGSYGPGSSEADYSRESYNSEGPYNGNRIRKPDPEELNDESRERESEESESVPSTVSSSLQSRYSGRGRSLEPYRKG